MEKKTAHLPEPSLNEAELLRLLVDAVTDYAIYMLDRDGFVTTWNPGAERIKGYRREEIIGQHFSRFFTLDDQARHVRETVLQIAARDGSYQAEGWRVRKDGGKFCASSVIHRVLGPTGELIGFAKVTRDVTERMEAQQALLESERRFRLLVEGVIDYAIYMLDPSGIIINWNAGAERMIGYSADEIITHHFSQIYTPADRAAGTPTRAIEAARRDGRHEAEGWRVRKDGSRFWASSVIDAIHNESGELVGFAEITRDITERQMAQQALRDSERQFRLLISGVGDYAIYMLDPNGIVTSWNLGAERIKGYSSKEIVGQHFSRFYTEQDRAAGMPAQALQTAAAQGRFEAENWRVRKDGSLFWANVLIHPIRENGELIGFAKITRDMSERRNSQIALDRAQAERAQSQKFEALGQLTSGVAHDFNNLLMVVSGYLTTLAKFVGDDTRGLRAIEAIELAGKRGQSLTRQLLSFARRQSLNPEVTRLAERVNAAKQLLATSVTSSLHIYDSIPPDTWTVKADVNELELALVNLGLNARDAMPQGGHVTISAQNRRLDGSETSERLAGEFVALSVADTGQGIPPDILPRIFEPFFTTKADKGSGLGLAQVYGFAKQSGGTLTAQSELGKGTVMTLYLPRAAEVMQQSAVPERPGRPSTGGAHVKILLVEDNPEVADATASMLNELTYSVIKSANADDALSRLENENVDLVISDIVMAGSRNGLDLGREIRQRHPQLPVILVTGYSDVAEDAVRDFVLLRKPYQFGELARAVSSMLAQAGVADAGNVIKLRPRKGD
jgi:PAS domain S-box-containing protein